MSFGFVEEEETVVVSVEESEAKAVEMLVLSVGEIFCEQPILSALLSDLNVLEAHDALVGSERWDGLVYVWAFGVVEVSLELGADGAEIEGEEYLKGLEKFEGA